jgi:hypothetical protein
MFDSGALTFREFSMREQVPLAAIHEAVLEFLRDRDDAVLFGAQAVNAYVHEPRMTQDIDLMSSRAKELAQELRAHITKRCHIALRIREVAEGRGFRLYQVRRAGNRHLADVRLVPALPAARRVARVLVLAPAELIARKVIAYHRRRGRPKAGTDWRDLAMLLLAFPQLKRAGGQVAAALKAAGADAETLAVWRELVAQKISREDEDEEFASG